MTRFQTVLDIGGITEAGLVLTGLAFADYPDRAVCFELILSAHGGYRKIPLFRLEWRSLKGGHSNQRRHGCAGPWGQKRVPATHMHTFQANWEPEKERMKRGDLPCAEPIGEEIQSFEQFRSFVGTSLNINNIGIVPRPDWRYSLFDEDGRDHGERR